MIKKIVLGILGFVIGMSIGFYFGSSFRNIIQDIFRFTTSDKIHFVGKNIFIFSDRTFEYVLGLALAIFLLSNLNLKLKQIFKNIILCLLIFGLSIFVMSAIDANLKVAACTSCENGIRTLHWNEINYGLIISISGIISIIPSLIRMLKQIKKPAANNGYN